MVLSLLAKTGCEQEHTQRMTHTASVIPRIRTPIPLTGKTGGVTPFHPETLGHENSNGEHPPL